MFIIIKLSMRWQVKNTVYTPQVLMEYNISMINGQVRYTLIRITNFNNLGVINRFWLLLSNGCDRACCRARSRWPAGRGTGG